MAVETNKEGQDQLDKKEDGGDKEDAGADSSVAPPPSNHLPVAPAVIRKQDEVTMRLPLDISACARPKEGTNQYIYMFLIINKSLITDLLKQSAHYLPLEYLAITVLCGIVDIATYFLYQLC